MEKDPRHKRERIASAWRTENLQRFGFSEIEIEGIQNFLEGTTRFPANFEAQWMFIMYQYQDEEKARVVGETLLANPKVIKFLYSMANASHNLHPEHKSSIDERVVRMIVSLVFRVTEGSCER